MLGKRNHISNKCDNKEKSHGNMQIAVVSLSILCLCLAGIVAMSPVNADETEFSEGDFVYTVVSETEHTVELSGLVDESQTSISIPGTVTHEGVQYTVVSIGDYSFYLLDGLSCDITIPASVKSIGTAAFEGAGITGLSFETDSVIQTIGYKSFNGCDSLDGKLAIPASVSLIGGTAFHSTSISSITFAQSTTELKLDASCFHDCKELTSVTIPANVTSIESNAFYGCVKLSQLSFETDGAKLSYIGHSAFSKNTALTCDVTIPKSVTEIDRYCFAYSGIKSISFDDNSKLKTIGDRAFTECNGLKSVSLPTSLSKIGNYSFWGSSAESLTFAASTEKSEGMTIGTFAFAKCDKLASEIIFPDNLVCIEERAFSECAVTHIVFSGNGPKEIGQWSFYKCESLAGELGILSDTEIIGERAFANCGLTNLTLSDQSSLVRIEKCAFFECYHLEITSLTLPASLDTIGDCAFNGTKIGSLTFTNGTEQMIIGTIAFENCGIGGTLTLPDNLVHIGAAAFKDNDFTSLVINNTSNLKELMDSAFDGCSNISGTIFIPKNLTNISANCFDGIGETAFDVDDNNTEYADENGWLMSKDKLTIEVARGNVSQNLVIPYGIVNLGVSAFASCNIVSLQLDDDLVLIGASAFSGCGQLKGNIAIPATVTEIGAMAFSGTQITSITFADNAAIKSIESSAFDGVDTLAGDLVIPASVEKIGNDAFSQTAVTSLSFKENSKLLSIGKNAFKNCKSLTSVTIPASTTVINDEAFCRVTNLVYVEFEEGSKISFIGDSAFMACNNLAHINFGTLKELDTVGKDVFTHNGTHAGTTMFKNSVSGDEFEFKLENKNLFANHVYSKISGEISDPLCRECTVTIDYDVEWYPSEEVQVYAGDKMDRPEIIETSYLVTTGWYWNGILWDFDDIVDGNMTLVMHYAEIDDGKSEIEAMSGSAEVNFGNPALNTASVTFGNNVSMKIDKNGCTDVLTVSILTESYGKYRTVVQGGYDGQVTITLPYDSSKGTPDVYVYVGGNKEKVQCEIDESNHTVVFMTAQPASDDIDSVYGIEYANSGTPIAAIIAVAIVAVILVTVGLLYFNRKA